MATRAAATIVTETTAVDSQAIANAKANANAKAIKIKKLVEIEDYTEAGKLAAAEHVDEFSLPSPGKNCRYLCPLCLARAIDKASLVCRLNGISCREDTDYNKWRVKTGQRTIGHFSSYWAAAAALCRHHAAAALCFTAQANTAAGNSTMAKMWDQV